MKKVVAIVGFVATLAACLPVEVEAGGGSWRGGGGRPSSGRWSNGWGRSGYPIYYYALSSFPYSAFTYSYPPQDYPAAPPPYAAPPGYYPQGYYPPAYYTMPPMVELQREVLFPEGRYILQGDGVSTPYRWVWVPNPPTAPPANPQ